MLPRAAALRALGPSIAASKLRMVSSGRSHRLRVGLDLSGSAIEEETSVYAATRPKILWQVRARTYWVAEDVSMLDCSERCE